MKPFIKVLISVGILVLLTVSFYYITRTISVVTGKSIFGWIIKDNTDTEKLENLAKCLTSKGAILYVRNGCPHCLAQKEDFKSALQFLDIVECTEQIELCEKKQLIGVPAWEIGGKLYYGRTELKELAGITGCSF